MQEALVKLHSERWIEQLYMQEFINPKPDNDHYWENGNMVMTESYHLRRGYCCKSGCRHCPYEKSRQNNRTTEIAAERIRENTERL